MVRSTDSSSKSRDASAATVWTCGALLVAAVVATYWNSLGVPFFFDDPIAIVKNPTIRNLRALGDVLSPPHNGSGVMGRPVVNLSLALNYACGGLAVGGYHFFNFALHACSGLALFGIVRRTLARPPLRARFGALALPVAFASAALWSLHPLQTESVTCVIQRTELLVGLFYLLTFYCFVRAVDEPTRKLWPALAVVASFLGMASKEVMVTAPFLVLLFDRTFVSGTFGEAWRRHRGLYLGLGASLLLLALLVAGGGGTRGEAAGFGVGVTWWSYALKQCEAIVLYLRLMLWPHPLVVFYGIDVIENPAEVWPQMLVLIALVAAVLVALWRRPVLGFFGFWFFAILAPSSSVIPLVSQTMSEHRLYLPLAGPLVLGVSALFLYAGRRAWIVALGVVLALGLVSARRNVDYRSELAIWTDTVTKAPNNARARINLGAALNAAGRTTEASAEYQAALRLDPNSPEAVNNVATLLLEAGRPAEAIEPCRAALRLRPDFDLAHNNLGSALIQTGHVAEGMAELQAALAINPDLPEAHCNLSGAFYSQGKFDEAIAHGEMAVRERPDFVLAHMNLASALIQKQESQRAMLHLETVIKLKPDSPEAQSNLGSLYYQAGDPQRAIPCYRAALQSKPDYVEAGSNLASALFQTGQVAEAIETYRATLRLQPTYVDAHLNLGLVLDRTGHTAEAIAEYEEALRLRPNDPRALAELTRLRSAAPQPPASKRP